MVVSGLAGGASVGLLTGSRVEAKEQVDLNADSVSARIFRLADINGKLKGAFGFEETGSPTLVFKDANEKNRFIITSHPSGPMLVFQDGKERMRVGMDLNESGEFSLIYFDEKKTHRANLIVNSTDGPKFGFMDDHGKIRLGMQLYQNSQPMLFLGNEQGKQEIILSLDNNFGPGLYLRDKAGLPLAAFTPQGQVFPEQAGASRKGTP
jgi:hypothetical protein